MRLRSFLQQSINPCRQAAAIKNLYRWSNSIQHWLYPPTCLLCGDPGYHDLDLCQPCYTQLPWMGPACFRCGLPVSGQTDGACGACQQQAPPFDHTVSAFRFEEPVRHMIHSLKFHQRYAHARLLGTLLAERILKEDTPRPDILIPMPLHPRRLKERGFNQSLEIARTVSRRTGTPIASDFCQRVRATEAQSQLHAASRQKNIHQAFAIQNGWRPSRHVAILDDVVTTAATVSELAKALRHAGVETIDVWSCARALRERH